MTTTMIDAYGYHDADYAAWLDSKQKMFNEANPVGKGRKASDEFSFDDLLDCYDGAMDCNDSRLAESVMTVIRERPEYPAFLDRQAKALRAEYAAQPSNDDVPF